MFADPSVAIIVTPEQWAAFREEKRKQWAMEDAGLAPRSFQYQPARLGYAEQEALMEEARADALGIIAR